MSHLTATTLHFYTGDPIAFAGTIETDLSASDVSAAEWRHPDLDSPITLADGDITVSDVSDGIHVQCDAGTPDLPANTAKEAQLLFDTGAGLQVVAVQTVKIDPRVDH